MIEEDATVDLERTVTQLSLLYSLCQNLAGRTSVEDACGAALDRLGDVVPFDLGVILSQEGGGARWTVRASKGVATTVREVGDGGPWLAEALHWRGERLFVDVPTRALVPLGIGCDVAWLWALPVAVDARARCAILLAGVRRFQPSRAHKWLLRAFAAHFSSVLRGCLGYLELEDKAAALEQANERVLDGLPTLVMIHRDDRVLWVNRTWVQKLGWQHADEVVGRTVLESIHPSSRPHVQQRMATPIAAQTAPLTTVRLLRRDGETVTVELSPAQCVDFDGPARLVVAVDVSERVALQQQLVTADRIASIGLLGAGVAHEINNPLAYALGSIELALRQVSRLPDAPQELGELLGIALEGLGRVRTIVRDLRMLTRPDDGPPCPIDVCEILESTLALAASALSDRVRVVREYHDVPLAAANGPRLAQVALNLVLNAVESMLEPGELRVRTLVDPAGRVAFEVEDTGTGIAPDILARVFDPFFTTKPIGRGTGLGLAICQQIVAGLGGEITVRSTVGRGSTFRVSLPPAGALSSAFVPESKSARPRPDRLRRRVLVIDDEPQLVGVIERMLSAHDVASTSSTAEALRLLSNGPLFAVVFCDLMMADMTGMQLYEELARTRPEVAARLVFMTAGAFTNEARDFLARVPNRHLEKPFTIEQIEAELNIARDS